MDVDREARITEEQPHAATRRAVLSPVPAGENDLAVEGEFEWQLGATGCCCWEWALEGDVLQRRRPCSLHCPVPAGSAT